MESFGGRWNEHCKGFKFDSLNNGDIQKIKETIKDGGVSLNAEKARREKDSFFPTPLSIVDKMIEAANIKDKDTVLDSSAGTGRIIHRVIDKYKVYSIALEPDAERFNSLRQDIHSRYQTTFEDALRYKIMRLEIHGCNKVLINPPFKNDKDIKHLMLSYAFSGDVADIVCIIQENSLHYKREVHKIFEKFIEILGDSIEFTKLPSGSFRTEMTTVDTVMVHIKKNFKEQEKALDLLFNNIDSLID